MRILISNVTYLESAVSQDSLNPVDIGIEDGKISFIQEHLPSRDQKTHLKEAAWDRVIEGRGRLALPGLVNAHTHLGMTLLRGYGDDLPLMVWLQEKMWPIEDQLTEKDVYWSSLLAIGEMLRGGITTCADMYFHMGATAKAVAEAGIRASLTRGVQDVGGSGLRGLEEAIGFCQKWQGAANGRITTMLGAHAPYTCTPGLLRKVADWANRLGVPIHTHVAETSTEVHQIKEQYGVTPLGMLAGNGVLDVPVTAVHCVHLEEDDLELATQRGVRVVHCPGSNMKLGSGIAPLPEMLATGLIVGLGTDSAASNNKLDLWEQMRLASLIHKANMQDATVIPAVTALKMATCHGAAALYLDKVGKLAPGWVADLVLVNTEGLHWQPPSNPQASIVYAGGRNDVSLVMVDGCIVYDQGELLTIDEDEVIYHVKKIAHRLGLL
jgi:5-methylthioadenosine/S-adenosylhomocysteine deaminase